MRYALLLLLAVALQAQEKSVCHVGDINAEGQFIYREIPCWQVPAKPLHMTQRTVWIAPPSFWAVRKWNDPPLRTNGQMLRSPVFWLGATASFGASVWDVRRSHGAGGYGDALGPWAGVTALDFVLGKYVWRPFSVFGAGWITWKHGYGAVTRKYQ
jgi:hypothetical protein